MGYPFDTPSWEGVNGAIFMGFGSSMPGLFSVIAIVACIAALVLGNGIELGKYKNHK